MALTGLSAALFGSLAIYGKFASRMGIPLTELLAVRFGAAAVILWGLAVVRGERLWWGRRTAGLAVMGLLYFGQAATYFGSLRTVPAAVTSILLYVYPGIVMLYAVVFLGEPAGRTRLLALALAVSGVFAVVDPLGARGSIDAAGVLLGLATASIYATYILAGRTLLQDVPAVVATAGIATMAGVAFTVVAAAAGQLRPLTGSGYALAGSMAVVAPTRAAIISTLEPAVTVVLAGILLGENLGPVRLIGGLVILVAAVIVARNVSPDLAEPRVRE